MLHCVISRPVCPAHQWCPDPCGHHPQSTRVCHLFPGSVPGDIRCVPYEIAKQRHFRIPMWERGPFKVCSMLPTPDTRATASPRPRQPPIPSLSSSSWAIQLKTSITSIRLSLSIISFSSKLSLFLTLSRYKEDYINYCHYHHHFIILIFRPKL